MPVRSVQVKMYVGRDLRLRMFPAAGMPVSVPVYFLRSIMAALFCFG